VLLCPVSGEGTLLKKSSARGLLVKPAPSLIALPGLDPGIHEASSGTSLAWMAGPSPAKAYLGWESRSRTEMAEPDSCWSSLRQPEPDQSGRSKNLHQPLGLMSPATISQPRGGRNNEQTSQTSPFFGDDWYWAS
jgi:hypothetical protein